MKRFLCCVLLIILSIIVFINIKTSWVIVLGMLLLVVAGILWIVTSYKERNEYKRVNKEYDQYAKEAEQALASEIEAVKGNSLKKELVKRRLVREYIEKNHPEASRHIDDSKFEGMHYFKFVFGICGYILASPFSIVILTYSLALLVCLYTFPFYYYVVINPIIAVLAVVPLFWKRYYILALISGVFAIIFLFGIYNVGILGIETPTRNILVEEGFIFRYPDEAQYTMYSGIILMTLTSVCMMLYPFLKKKTIILWICVAMFLSMLVHSGMCGSHIYDFFRVVNAEFAVMIGLSYNEAYMLIFYYALSLLPVICAIPPYVRSLRACRQQVVKTHANKVYTEKCNKIYRKCMTWLIFNLVVLALLWGYFVGLPMQEAATILVHDCNTISNFVGINYYLVCIIPASLSIICSRILYNYTKRNLKTI